MFLTYIRSLKIAAPTFLSTLPPESLIWGGFFFLVVEEEEEIMHRPVSP